MIRVLVCGGRDHKNMALVFKTLDEINESEGISLIIQGGARGADAQAAAWAKTRGIPCRTYPAQWNDHGTSAGRIRNKQMLEEGKPDLVVAFPGGVGTGNMLDLAEEAHIPIRRPDHEDQKREGGFH